MSDSLGDRIKKYEGVYKRHLTSKMPVIVRLDGKAFHTYTKGFNRPFDHRIIDGMVYAAKKVAENMQGFKLGYIQSDEASFLITDYYDVNTQGWFNYNHDKIVSISASLMTIHFNRYMHSRALYDKIALFDSRAFNVPREDVVNCFLWRCQDWKRNSLQMYARSVFSHKELHKKNASDMHEMLYSEGKNWATDLMDVEKNGTFLVKEDREIQRRHDILPEYSSIALVAEPLLYPLISVEERKA